ncbi:MAG: hypothetical protein ABL951_02290 [Alphaproteobacteria bacterium]
MIASPSLLNPGHRHLAGFLVISFVLHILWFVWFTLQGAAIFAPQDSGMLGLGGGGDDIVFQLSRGSSGGPQAEILGSDMDLQEALPETLAEDQVEVPLVEEEAAIPIAPAEDTVEKEKQKAASDAATARAAQAASDAAAKKRSGGDGGDAEETRRSRGGTALSGPQISSSAAGRTLNLLAGRLDIPSGNRLMNMKMNLFPDGTMRVALTYFHYKTFHKLVTSTRNFKGDGKWWVENNSLCLQAMVIEYGTINCYDLNQKPDGNLDMYFSQCTGRSSSICRKDRLGAQGNFSSGID